MSGADTVFTYLSDNSIALPASSTRASRSIRTASHANLSLKVVGDSVPVGRGFGGRDALVP